MIPVPMVSKTKAVGLLTLDCLTQEKGEVKGPPAYCRPPFEVMCNNSPERKGVAGVKITVSRDVVYVPVRCPVSSPHIFRLVAVAVDALADTVISSIFLGYLPYSISVHPSGNRLYIGHTSDPIRVLNITNNTIGRACHKELGIIRIQRKSPWLYT